MNDFKELQYFDELISQVISNKGRKSSLIKQYQERIKSADLNSYIFCMSYERDLLSNWVKYGDNGKGFAIGFNKKSFDFNSVDKTCDIFSNTQLEMRPIKYIDKNQCEFVKNVLEMFTKSVNAECDKFHKEYTLTPLLVNELLLLRNFVKNKYFEEERECRLLLHYDNARNGYDVFRDVVGELSYRAKSDCLVPYYPVKLDDNNFVSEIVIGPKNNSKEVDIHNFISNFFPCSKVTRSDIPYT